MQPKRMRRPPRRTVAPRINSGAQIANADDVAATFPGTTQQFSAHHLRCLLQPAKVIAIANGYLNNALYTPAPPICSHHRGSVPSPCVGTTEQ